jgi:hypothetical protein
MNRTKVADCRKCENPIYLEDDYVVDYTNEKGGYYHKACSPKRIDI